MSTQEAKPAEKFWEKFNFFAKNVLLNKKVFWSILSVILVVLVAGIILVMDREKKHNSVKELYAKAFQKYQEVEKNMDKLNMERAGIAISQLEKVTETGYAFPENFLAYYELGNIYAALDKLELAQKYYLKLKEADEDFFVRGKALLNLAKIYQTQKKYDEAIEIFELLISDYDNYYQDMAYFFMGMVYEAKNETDKAISSYKMVRKDTSYQFEAEKNIEVLNRLQNLETESAK